MTGHTTNTGLALSAVAEAESMVSTQLKPKSAEMRFPVGYHSLHADVSMNFQMNRWYSWVGEPEMLEEMRVAALRIANYADWKREFVALAESSQKRGHILRAGIYWRSAEFFMRPNTPERKNARIKFLAAIRSVYARDLGDLHTVPYVDGNSRGVLPAYRFTPAQSKGTIVFFGGFDSYIEELTQAFIYLRDAGYEVIAFEGPGQGGALNDADLHMTAEWHKPVKSVLDYFKLDRVTLIGLSMGGCLVMRAAALEERVERVIAYDIYPDALDVNLRQVTLLRRRLLKVLLELRAATVVNMIAKQVAKTSPVARWGIDAGMHVNGASSPYEFFRKTERYITADVSALIKQDVLLLAGSDDHLVPMEHFYNQTKSLSNARSVTARVFTRSESAQNHCQVGNYDLALRTIVAWLDAMLLEDAERRQSPPEVDVASIASVPAFWQEKTMAGVNLTASPSTLSYKRSASTGAFSTLLLFTLGWVEVFIGLPLVLTHAFIGLFTLEPAGSLSSFLIGGLSAFLSGGVAGAIIAHCYNLAGRFFGD